MAEVNDVNGNTELQREANGLTTSSQQESDPEGFDPHGTSSHQVHVQRGSSSNTHKFPTSLSSSLASSVILNRVKVILSGDVGVGKSTFLRTFARVESGKLIKADASHVTRIIKYGDRDIEVHLMDTSGQERYRSLTTSYYRNANGCFLLFNFDLPKSFYDLHMWLEDIQKYCTDDQIDVVIVGFDKAPPPTTNSDTPDISGVSSESELPSITEEGICSNVTSQQAQQFAESRGLQYVHASSDPDSVVSAIYCLLERIIDRAVQNSSCASRPTTIRPRSSSSGSSTGRKCCPC